jgi:hypothetical protein
MTASVKTLALLVFRRLKSTYPRRPPVLPICAAGTPLPGRDLDIDVRATPNRDRQVADAVGGEGLVAEVRADVGRLVRLVPVGSRSYVDPQRNA